MDEPVDKVPELPSSDEVLRVIRDIGRISVTGYDTGLPREDVERAMWKHFASCGEITDVYIDTDCHKENALGDRGYIYFLGEGAVDKALQLDGSEVGGQKISVEYFPFPEHANDKATLRVEGYDTSLSKNDIESALIKLFSPYGEINRVLISDNGSAEVDLDGEDAAVKAPVEVSGSVIGGRKVVVRLLSALGKTAVYMRPPHGPFCGPYCPRKRKFDS